METGSELKRLGLNPDETTEDGQDKLYWGVDDLAKMLQEHRANQLMTSLGISGDMGVGKSQLSFHIAQASDKNFALERNFFFTANTALILKKIDAMEVECTPVLDEAILSLFIQQWYRPEIQAFYQYVQAALRKRKRGVLVMNIPSIYDLPTTFIRNGLTFWIHVITPGIAAIMLKNPGPFPDPFFRKELQDKWAKTAKANRIPVEEQTALDFQMNLYRRHYMSFFRFLSYPRMADIDYDDYLEFYDKSNTLQELMKKVDDILTPNTKQKTDAGCGCHVGEDGKWITCPYHTPRSKRKLVEIGERGNP